MCLWCILEEVAESDRKKLKKFESRTLLEDLYSSSSCTFPVYPEFVALTSLLAASHDKSENPVSNLILPRSIKKS